MADLTDKQADAIDRLILESSQRLIGFMDEQGIMGRPGAWDDLVEEIDTLLRTFLERVEEIMAEKEAADGK